MTNQSQLNPSGVSNSAPTAPPPDMQSTNAAASASTLATLAQTVPENPISRDTANLLESLQNDESLLANALAMRMLCAFADKLKAENMVSWHSVTLKDGRSGWALFFSADRWENTGQNLSQRVSKR